MIDGFSEEDISRLLGEPKEQTPEDGFWRWSVPMQESISLEFSINIFERSVQTQVIVNGEVVTTTSSEKASRIRCDVKAKTVTVVFGNEHRKLAVKTLPTPTASWSLLES